MSTEQIIAYQGEVMLLGWSETSNRGRTITLQLPADGEGHPFSTAVTKHGKTAGQRYAIVMVEIGDDEKPVEKTPSQIAFLLCKDPAFQHFLNERSFATVDDEDSARACICEGCGIKSRGELDKDPGARSAWLTQFYNPWTAQQAAQSKRIFG
jgi:hypothetical protein